MNINELINKMTIEEKVAQLLQIAYTSIPKEEALIWAKRGVGSFLHVFGEDALELQRLAISSGNKIPLIFGIDAIHGHALNDKCTVFPTQLSLACSWNEELVQKVGHVTATEVSADGLHWTFSPVLCLGRDLRWGRVGETFGEDKYLSGKLGAAIIKGYQGESLKDNNSILACAKHFIGYGEATGGRDSYDTSITYRKLKDTFLPPFEEAVKAGCKSFMTAYGSIDGTPCTIDKKLLTTILKEQLKFKGFIVTDWQNVTHEINDQLVASDFKEASKLALTAGNDMMMNTIEFFDATIELIKNNEISMDIIDDAVRRIITVKEELGLFDNPFKCADKSLMGCTEHLNVNKEVTDECITLLKNENILPLKKETKILLIGDHANDLRLQYGDWTYFSHPNWLNYYKRLPVRPYVTLKEGLESEFNNVKYIKGFDMDKEELVDAELIQKEAPNYDVIVFACGDARFLSCESCDRANPNLTDAQEQVFELIKQTNKPVVTVLVSAKPLCMDSVIDYSKAFITGFNTGMFGGKSIAEVLVGKLNPSGKLPISFASNIGQLPVYYNQLPGWHNTKYIDQNEKLPFVFGDGLSYSTYSYSNIKFDQDKLTLSVDVTNTSNMDGKEIVQVYFRDLVSSIITPVKQLIAFKKEFIKAKETKTCSFKLNKMDFSFVNSYEERIVERGEFELMIGPSSRDEVLNKIKFTLK